MLRVVDASPEGYRERARQQVVNPGAVNNVPPLVSNGTILVRNQEEMVALVPTGSSGVTSRRVPILPSRMAP